MMLNMGKRGPKPSMDKRDEAMQLRLDGLTFGDIAAKLGISRQRVQQLLAPPRDVRDSVVIDARGLCVSCQLFVGTAGHVHHVQATNIEDEDYNDRQNLVLLCRSCHRTAHRSTPQNKVRSKAELKVEMKYSKNRHGDSFYAAIGERILLARRRAGINQRDFGRKLGISHAAVSDLERGKTKPDLDNLAVIAEALGVPLTDIVVLED